MNFGIKTFNVLDCQLTDRSLILLCENNETITVEKSNVKFLLNIWDKRSDLACEIRVGQTNNAVTANIPSVVIQRLEILAQEKIRQGVKL